MNKNAAIIEGDTTKKFNPVSKVKVSNSDTGESTWIPEDSKETHSLSVIKNGIYYAASEGYTAYDTVTVNVSSETEVNYEGILADMPDLADLGLYDLDDLEGLEGLDLDLEELQDLENLILDGDLEEGEIPTSGSTIKGIDPDTGETLEVGLDEDGNLMEQALPDHIKIVVLPAKRHYQEGELLDFSYMHVYLMKKGTERFTCEQYPTGEIPFSELMFPVTVAEGSGESEQYSDGDGVNAVMLSVSFIPDEYYGAYRTVSPIFTIPSTAGLPYPNCYYGGWGEQTCLFTVYNNQLYIMLKSGVNEVGFVRMYKNQARPGEYYWYASMSTNFLVQDEFVTRNTPYLEEQSQWLVPQSTKDPTQAGTMKPVDVTVPVQWMRSDGDILEDTYTITIGDGEDPEPEPDPYAGAYDFIWEGKAYCFNKSLARSEVMYSNGTVWQTWLGGQSPPYTVDQALKLKLIVQVGWSGGGSTSGGF